MISTIQRHTGNGDNGTVGLPLAQRPGIVIPTPDNLQAVADKAEAQRNRTAAEITPQEFGQQYGIPRDLSLFLQRMEATLIEQGREIAWLKTQIFNPPHTRNVERRG